MAKIWSQNDPARPSSVGKLIFDFGKFNQQTINIAEKLSHLETNFVLNVWSLPSETKK